MKKRILPILMVLLLCTLFCVSCEIGDANVPITVDVTYVLNNGQADITSSVTTILGIVKAPEPTRENYLFGGWYLDKTLTRPYDIGTALKSDITLYASWIFDYETYINNARELLLPATVTVKAYTYTQGFLTTQITSSQAGSGVVIFEDNRYYYILTNHHVTYLTAGGYKGYEITDIYGQTQEASLLFSSVDDDLALLQIRRDTRQNPLPVVPVAQEDALPKDICMAVGSPGGIQNTLTLGRIKSIRDVTLTDNDKNTSNVTYDVLWHTAPIDHGSSGGPLFGDNYELIGLNYAAAVENGKFSEGYAIPAEKIRNFLRQTVLQNYF